MTTRCAWLFCGALFAALQLAAAQRMTVPQTIQAGSAFQIQTTGSGNGVLYIVGPGQMLRKDVKLGNTASVDAGLLTNAGQYLVILTGGSSTEQHPLDVLPANQAAHLTFLARPSRLPVNLRNGISGAVYVFDAYHNLITQPLTVSFNLTPPAGAAQHRNVTAVNGAAWVQLDSTAKEGMSQFVAQAGGVSSRRIIEQVPGDPCGLRMSAQPEGEQVQLKTDPVRDCSGNAVPDGTIVTFTEGYQGMQSTVDVPLKRGIAQVKMPAHPGATISVASGVVLGNEIHWER
ncbi:MAG: hypothetical protein WBD10_02550 [Acidobacteriaceae bacterium]